MAIAWANPRAAGVSMNIDLVQSVAHILVRECFQAKIDALLEMSTKAVRDDNGNQFISVEDLSDKLNELKFELSKHESSGVESNRTFERSVEVGEEQ